MKILKKMLVPFLIAFSLVTYNFLQTTEKERNTDRLVIGTAVGYAPFVSINERGEYEGFDIDVAQELAQHLGKRLVIQDLGSMNSLFIALEQAKVDALIWGLSITSDRLEKVAMVHYQGAKTDSYPLLFWKQIPVNIKSMEDMTGKVISVEPSSSQDAVISKYPFIKKLETERVDDALLNIQYGKSDAAFVEPAIAEKFKEKYPEIKTLDISLAIEDQVQGVGVVVKRENAQLIKEIEEAVNQLKAASIIETLEKKWNMRP